MVTSSLLTNIQKFGSFYRREQNMF